MSWLALQHLFNILQIPVSLPPVDGWTAWLVDRDEGGGANFPPGGGGRRPRPPELWGRVLSFFLDCWKLQGNEMREKIKWENEPEHQIYGTIRNVNPLVHLVNLIKNYPDIESNSLAFFEAQVQFRSGVWSLCLLAELALLFHPPT